MNVVGAELPLSVVTTTPTPGWAPAGGAGATAVQEVWEGHDVDAVTPPKVTCTTPLRGL